MLTASLMLVPACIVTVLMVGLMEFILGNAMLVLAVIATDSLVRSPEVACSWNV